MPFERLELSGFTGPVNALESDEANHEWSIMDGTRNRNYLRSFSEAWVCEAVRRKPNLRFAFTQQQVDAVHELGAGKWFGNVIVSA